MKKRFKAFVAVQYPKSASPFIGTYYCGYQKRLVWNALIRNYSPRNWTKKDAMKSGWRVLPCYIEVEL